MNFVTRPNYGTAKWIHGRTMPGMEMGYAFAHQEHNSVTLVSCSVRESIPARRNQRNDVKNHAKRKASARPTPRLHDAGRI